jgi:uncharacterized membrane protein
MSEDSNTDLTKAENPDGATERLRDSYFDAHPNEQGEAYTENGAHVPFGAIVSAEFSGPLPPPGLLAGYEHAVPGSAQRIITMAEQDAACIRRVREEYASQTRQSIDAIENSNKRDHIERMTNLGINGCLILILLAIVSFFAFFCFGVALIALYLNLNTWIVAISSASGVIMAIGSLVIGAKERRKSQKMLKAESSVKIDDVQKLLEDLAKASDPNEHDLEE